MQNFGVTNKEHYGMLWYFWSGQFTSLEGEGNWAEITFAKTPGIVFKDRGKNLAIS